MQTKALKKLEGTETQTCVRDASFCLQLCVWSLPLYMKIQILSSKPKESKILGTSTCSRRSWNSLFFLQIPLSMGSQFSLKLAKWSKNPNSTCPESGLLHVPCAPSPEHLLEWVLLKLLGTPQPAPKSAYLGCYLGWLILCQLFWSHSVQIFSQVLFCTFL